MKNCPKCGKVYADETLNFCLEDGQWLREESRDEPLTAILHSTEPLGEAATRAQAVAPNETATLSSNIGDVLPKSGGLNKRLFVVPFLLAIIVLGGFFSYRYFASVNSKQIESVAVMPFVNESGTADVEYLSDGMTETLIRSLSQLPNLNVKARSSVFRYKGKETDTKTIGKELGVQAVLNGRVIQRGDQLSLNLELIDAQTENVIWTDQYDRKASDLVSLQNEIASDVSGRLKIRLSGVDQQKLAKIYTTDPEAYKLYLQGRFYWNKRTKSEVQKAIPYFKQAVERDLNFALGYVGLADSDEDNDGPLKKEYIRRALELDDQLAEAHASLGYQYMLDYDWTASERELQRAIELDSKYPQAYQWNGARLMMIGKYNEALASIQHALDL
ncbi:MAG TPA: hypothetical protein VGQ55_04910, partial [Pyrinomonadaceae bacterium]|nr:hypothetical protein [Pyrinomonadaceae bacterium]